MRKNLLLSVALGAITGISSLQASDEGRAMQFGGDGAMESDAQNTRVADVDQDYADAAPGAKRRRGKGDSGPNAKKSKKLQQVYSTWNVVLGPNATFEQLTAILETVDALPSADKYRDAELDKNMHYLSDAKNKQIKMIVIKTALIYMAALNTQDPFSKKRYLELFQNLIIDYYKKNKNISRATKRRNLQDAFIGKIPNDDFTDLINTWAIDFCFDGGLDKIKSIMEEVDISSLMSIDIATSYFDAKSPNFIGGQYHDFLRPFGDACKREDGSGERDTPIAYFLAKEEVCVDMKNTLGRYRGLASKEGPTLKVSYRIPSSYIINLLHIYYMTLCTHLLVHPGSVDFFIELSHKYYRTSAEELILLLTALTNIPLSEDQNSTTSYNEQFNQIFGRAVALLGDVKDTSKLWNDGGERLFFAFTEAINRLKIVHGTIDDRGDIKMVSHQLIEMALRHGTLTQYGNHEFIDKLGNLARDTNFSDNPEAYTLCHAHPSLKKLAQMVRHDLFTNPEKLAKVELKVIDSIFYQDAISLSKQPVGFKFQAYMPNIMEIPANQYTDIADRFKDASLYARIVLNMLAFYGQHDAASRIPGDDYGKNLAALTATETDEQFNEQCLAPFKKNHLRIVASDCFLGADFAEQINTALESSRKSIKEEKHEEALLTLNLIHHQLQTNELVGELQRIAEEVSIGIVKCCRSLGREHKLNPANFHLYANYLPSLTFLTPGLTLKYGTEPFRFIANIEKDFPKELLEFLEYDRSKIYHGVVKSHLTEGWRYRPVSFSENAWDSPETSSISRNPSINDVITKVVKTSGIPHEDLHALGDIDFGDDRAKIDSLAGAISQIHGMLKSYSKANDIAYVSPNRMLNHSSKHMIAADQNKMELVFERERLKQQLLELLLPHIINKPTKVANMRQILFDPIVQSYYNPSMVTNVTQAQWVHIVTLVNNKYTQPGVAATSSAAAGLEIDDAAAENIRRFIEYMEKEQTTKDRFAAVWNIIEKTADRELINATIYRIAEAGLACVERARQGLIQMEMSVIDKKGADNDTFAFRVSRYVQIGFKFSMIKHLLDSDPFYLKALEVDVERFYTLLLKDFVKLVTYDNGSMEIPTAGSSALPLPKALSRAFTYFRTQFVPFMIGEVTQRGSEQFVSDYAAMHGKPLADAWMEAAFDPADPRNLGLDIDDPNFYQLATFKPKADVIVAMLEAAGWLKTIEPKVAAAAEMDIR